MSVLTASDAGRASHTPARRWAILALTLAAFAPLSFFFIDRAVATLSYEHLRGYRRFFDGLTHVGEPLPAIAVVILAWSLVVFLRGKSFGPVLDTLTRTSLALMVTIAVKDQLKYAFGRTWPETWTNNNPSFFGNGTYGFFPFHGGQGWYAFPSGHTATICAVAAALWVQWPRGRALYALAVCAVVVGLIGADYHWVTDIVVGGALGTTIGIVFAKAGRRS